MTREDFFKRVAQLVARLPADIQGGVEIWLIILWGVRRG